MFCLLFCFVFTLHVLYCVIIILLNVINWMFLFFYAANCFGAGGNNLLYKCKDIMFPSLPLATLYDTIIETWFDDVFRFAVITDYLLVKI